MVTFPGHKVPDRERGYTIDQIWEWVRQIVEAVTLIFDGATNAKGSVTLTANTTTTTLTDQKIGAFTTVFLSPRTSNAAAALGTTYQSSETQGSAVLTHANNAQTDRTFDYIL